MFECLRSYLHLETVDHVLFVLAVAVASRIDRGDPLWGLLIGPASSGKTEIIRMLDRVADEHPDEITAPSLLSWSKGKDAKAVGILARLPSPGLLTVADFSTVLATSDRGGRDQLFALLRRAYDGAVSRDLGNTPRPLTWQGRLTLLAGCTPIIDSYSSHADALGPRWLYCRIDAQDTETKRETGRRALSAGQLADHRARAADLAEAIVHAAERHLPDALDPALAEALLDAAIVACYGRAAVERDGYGRREISSMAQIEEPPRLAGQLALLARSLLALGLDSEQVASMCRRCALDSIPQARRGALNVLAGMDPTASAVGRLAGCHRHVATMALEEPEQLTERLRAAGVRTEEFKFTDAGVNRLARTLYGALRDRAILLPDVEELVAELGSVRLVEKGPGLVRLDHRAGQHDDQSVCCAMVAASLLERPTGTLSLSVAEGTIPTAPIGRPHVAPHEPAVEVVKPGQPRPVEAKLRFRNARRDPKYQPPGSWR